eukprot:849873-Amphidinium_carterae.1
MKNQRQEAKNMIFSVCIRDRTQRINDASTFPSYILLASTEWNLRSDFPASEKQAGTFWPKPRRM